MISVPTYHVYPCQAVGAVRFGMMPSSVYSALNAEPECRYRKSPSDPHEVDCYHDSTFQIFYGGDEPAVNYIELTSYGGKFVVLFRGLDVFNVGAMELIARVGENDSFDPNDPELGFSYTFPSIEVCFWRPAVPEDDPDCEYFQVMGIGARGYYSERVR